MRFIAIAIFRSVFREALHGPRRSEASIVSPKKGVRGRIHQNGGPPDTDLLGGISATRA